MDYYFLIITAICVLAMGIMYVLAKYNETLNRQQKRWFMVSFLLVMAVSVLEMVTVVVNGKPVSFRWLNIIANYLGFGLSPAVAISLAAALGRHQEIKYAFFLGFIYLLFLGVTFSHKLIFYVDQNNQYVRGKFLPYM